MSSTSRNGSSAGSSRIRARRSIAHMPSSNKGTGIEKENTTTDVSATRIPKSASQKDAKDKKSRSKSLGPGGLDALQNGSGNKQKPRASFVPLKSILKPAIPVSPPRTIPSFEATRRRTPSRSPRRSPRKGGSQVESESRTTGEDDLLIDFSTPTAPNARANNQSNPFDSFNLVPGQAGAGAEQDQWAKEEWERREREKQAILDQRAARRKSMANRRVSFAPEATLHTWNVVEVPEDSTTSSASTNSTRRASSMTTGSIQPSATPSHDYDPTDPPSTPPEQVEDQDGSPSPAHQRDLHQKKNRHSLGPPPVQFNNPADARSLSSSPYSGSSVTGSEDNEAPIADDDPSDSDDDVDDVDDDADSTAMSMDDATGRSMASIRSDGSTTSSGGRLEEALRQAAREAGTKGIDFDENGDLSMEFADEEITGAFQPWIKKKSNVDDIDINDLSSRQDQENVNPFYQANPAQHYQAAQDEDDEDEGLTMDITNVVGGILSRRSGDSSPGKRSRKSISANRRESAISRRSFGDASTVGDRTMEFTNVVGGIAPSGSPAKSADEDSNVEDDEDMTMEFTNVFGNGLVNSNYDSSGRDGQDEPETRSPQTYPEPEPSDSGAEEYYMDETGVIGGILPPIEERTEPQEDQTMGMEITTAMGKILPSSMHSNKVQARSLMEHEAESLQPASSPFMENVIPSPQKVPASHHLATVTSEHGSPSLAAVKSRPGRRSSGPRLSATPKSHPRVTTPVKKLATPSKQLTPQPGRPTTPGKTPPSSNVTLRSASPKKLFKPELRAKSARNSPRSPVNRSSEKSVFGNPTANLVLRPSNRRSSGLGVDKEGLGSPRVAEVLDRRRSIGDDASEFVPQHETPRGVRFQDPRQIEKEIDHEFEEERRSSGRRSAEEDQENTSQSLRDMISSLTPKKNKLKGRKSLHVGAAKGLLGKRPLELDQDDDEEDDTPKRLKGREASPVKAVRLPAPPSKDETVGRVTASARKPMQPVLYPQKGLSRRHSTANGVLSAPKDLARTRQSESPVRNRTPTLETVEDYDAEERTQEVENADPETEPIHLQQFLEMTNIHFMELTTTKRRHTMLMGSGKKPRRKSGEGKGEASLEDCVAAGFCTVPMLELYQHSCRELKSYISEGRSILRSIESETYAENPPLFREYVNAQPDIRLLMDNQFRNVKTHARLLSKSMWYEWRMKLIEGLKAGLVRHIDEINADDAVLSKKERLLDSVVPDLVERHASLKTEAEELRRNAEELENCDQDELRHKREKLAAVEAQIQKKKRLLEDWQEDLQDKNQLIEEGNELKANYLQQINEAERVMEECRGWSVNEVNELKASVQDLERQTGWYIVSATPSPDSPAGPALAMSYRNDVCVIFHPGAFRIPQRQTDTNMPLELKFGSSKTLLAQNRKLKTNRQPSPEQSLVLQTLSAHLTQLPQASVAPKQLLGLISSSWDVALGLSEELRMLGFCGVTRPTMVAGEDKFSPDTKILKIRCILLGWVSNQADGKKKVKQEPAAQAKVRARVNIDLTIKAFIQQGSEPGDAALDVDIGVSATKAYGFSETSNTSESQMSDMLKRLICGGQKAEIGSGVWCKAVKELEGKVFM
ncbi:hypothetical protein FQN54_003761 [Arachnomyces sp. PD_36]|nr:hypothetical protein FQN54_003761 [Arachnomyces sp. PD_36]